MELNPTLRRVYRNIHCLRLAYKLTQKQMAEIMGISVDTLRKMEQGKHTPRICCDILWRVCDAFNISADVLLKLDFQFPEGTKTPPLG